VKTEQVQINLWTPHPNQLKLLKDQSRFKVIVCGRRFGKTTYAVNTLIKQALLTPDGLFWYVAPTYKQAKNIAWTMLQRSLRQLPEELVHKVNESELFVEIGNGSRIAIKGADNADSLRGTGIHGVVMDEYQDTKPSVFDEVIRPMLTDYKGWGIFIGTPKGFNHFYDLFTTLAPKRNWSTYRFTSFDNPLIDPKELEEARKTTPENKFAQEYLADFRKQEGLVYKEFDREKHVYKEAKINSAETILGVDFGFTNPAAILTILKDKDRHYWVSGEYYKTGRTTAQIIEYCQSQKPTLVYPDPAEPDRILEMENAGLNCREVIKDVATGIDRLHELFKAGRVHIHESCTNLIWELETYAYPDTRNINPNALNRNLKEDPIKENDHAVDALRYALYMQEPVDEPSTYKQPAFEQDSLYFNAA